MAARTTPQAVIDSMARAIAQEPDQDAAALDRLEGALQGELITLASRPSWALKELLAVVTDQSKDWRLRRFAALPLGQSKSDRLAEPLAAILLDKKERPEVRGGAAMGLMGVATKDKKAREALHQVAQEPNIPRGLMDDVMFVIGNTGTDDIDLMLKIAGMPSGNLKSQVVNWQAIRAIALKAWKDDRAMDILVKFMIDAPNGSMLRQIALDELLQIATYEPDRIKPWVGRLVEPLLKMTHIDKANLPTIIILIGKIQDRRAVGRLIEIMNDTTLDPLITGRCVYALGEIGDKSALPAVQKLWNMLPAHPNLDLKGDWEFTAKNCPWIVEAKFVDKKCPGLQRIQWIRWGLERLKAAKD